MRSRRTAIVSAVGGGGLLMTIPAIIVLWSGTRYDHYRLYYVVSITVILYTLIDRLRSILDGLCLEPEGPKSRARLVSSGAFTHRVRAAAFVVGTTIVCGVAYRWPPTAVRSLYMQAVDRDIDAASSFHELQNKKGGEVIEGLRQRRRQAPEGIECTGECSDTINKIVAVSENVIRELDRIIGDVIDLHSVAGDLTWVVTRSRRLLDMVDIWHHLIARLYGVADSVKDIGPCTPTRGTGVVARDDRSAIRRMTCDCAVLSPGNQNITTCRVMASIAARVKEMHRGEESKEVLKCMCMRIARLSCKARCLLERTEERLGEEL